MVLDAGLQWCSVGLEELGELNKGSSRSSVHSKSGKVIMEDQEVVKRLEE